jgi:hypothetical protein
MVRSSWPTVGRDCVFDVEERCGGSGGRTPELSGRGAVWVGCKEGGEACAAPGAGVGVVDEGEGVMVTARYAFRQGTRAWRDHSRCLFGLSCHTG